MKKIKGSIIKEIINEVNEYNESVKNGTATEDMATVLKRACKKAGVNISDKEIKRKSKEINGTSKDSFDIDELIKELDKKLDELDNQNK